MELKVLNFEMMKKPANWAIVLIMFVFAALFVEIVMQLFNINIGGLPNGNIVSST